MPDNQSDSHANHVGNSSRIASSHFGTFDGHQSWRGYKFSVDQEVYLISLMAYQARDNPREDKNMVIQLHAIENCSANMNTCSLAKEIISYPLTRQGRNEISLLSSSNPPSLSPKVQYALLLGGTEGVQHGLGGPLTSLNSSHPVIWENELVIQTDQGPSVGMEFCGSSSILRHPHRQWLMLAVLVAWCASTKFIAVSNNYW
eukprot:gb/GECG01000544.1/.p1 GENE.gb/GECG01000544.1/~~gb/GECG01000544.1/.p1  ORF type:complete len:202 (+),score=7.92 gb/GECG01000544.1/:1-606(+)